MTTAAELAEKFGLQRYLDNPAELNDMIFRLMLLQETMQLERAATMHDGTAMIAVKRTAHGKFVASCRGDRTFRYAVETAMEAATLTIAVFQRKRFEQYLRKMGIPEKDISLFCDSVTIDDDTYCSTVAQ